MEISQESESFLYVRLALKIFKQNWYIFAASVGICMSLALFINWYLQPHYTVGSVIMINDRQDNPKVDASEEFMKTFQIFTPVSNIQGEILKMKSSDMIYKALEQIHSEVTYSVKNGIKTKELYDNAPFHVKFSTDHVQPINVNFQIIPVSDKKFRLIAEQSEMVQFYNYEKNKVELIKDFSINKEFSYDDVIESNLLKIQVIAGKTRFSDFPEDSKFYFVINNLSSLVFAYQKDVNIEQVAKDINACTIKLNVTNPQKGIDFINALTQAYLQRNIDKKNSVAENTIQYLDNQLGVIEDSLNITEGNLQSFKSTNEIMEIQSKADQVFRGAEELEKEKAELMAKDKYYKYIKQNLDNDVQGDYLIVPSSMGVNDNVLAGLINDYIEMISERNNLIHNKQTKSPYFSTLSVKISTLKSTITENLKNLINTNAIQLSTILERLGKENSRIKALPQTQRKLVGIERKYRLNDDLYTYMLKKKEEAEIAKASNLPTNDILETAKLLQYKAVSPNKTVNMAVAVALGLILPFGFFGIRGLMNGSISNTNTVHSLTQYLSAGQIFKGKLKKDGVVLTDSPKSAISESIRTVRTNIDHFLEGKKNKVVMFTSTKSGEGKSFTSLNLAMSFAMLDKKTILLDFDMRKPNLYQALKTDNNKGISTILTGVTSLEDSIVKTNFANLDFIPSGPLPHNPSELTESEKTSQLLNTLKSQYDYVVIDTPPIGLVADGYLIMKHSDVKIFVIRENVTPVKQLALLLKELESKKTTDLYWLMNDVDISDTFLAKENEYFSQS